jgi:hypothetical protein
MSAIPALRQAICRYLEQHPDMHGVPVLYGWGKIEATEAVLVDGPDPTDSEWTDLGTNSIDDFITIPVRIEVRAPMLSAAETDDRADELLDIARGLAAADAIRGLLTMEPTPVLDEWVNFRDSDRWVTQITLNLRCRIRGVLN